MSGVLVVKVCVETEEGELLAVHETRVADDLLTRKTDPTHDQNAFDSRVATAAANAYREAVGK